MSYTYELFATHFKTEIGNESYLIIKRKRQSLNNTLYMNFRPIQDFPKDFASTWAQAQQFQPTVENVSV